jgi:C-terminal processing protease CtpA/Prc
MLVNTANYSNGYEIPQIYQSLGIGKLVGTAVAGTGLGGAETRVTGGLAISIANDLSRDAQGRDLEGLVVQPDFLVEETPADRATGREPQLEKAVAILLAPKN